MEDESVLACCAVIAAVLAFFAAIEALRTQRVFRQRNPDRRCFGGTGTHTLLGVFDHNEPPTTLRADVWVQRITGQAVGIAQLACLRLQNCFVHVEHGHRVS